MSRPGASSLFDRGASRSHSPGTRGTAVTGRDGCKRGSSAARQVDIPDIWRRSEPSDRSAVKGGVMKPVTDSRGLVAHAERTHRALEHTCWRRCHSGDVRPPAP
jgi:hypothetical protein